jgi:hypothetical protein
LVFSLFIVHKANTHTVELLHFFKTGQTVTSTY